MGDVGVESGRFGKQGLHIRNGFAERFARGPGELLKDRAVYVKET
jgi:hypothetical protein